MNYVFSIEDLETNYAEFEPLYRQHYGEMQTRLAGQGITIAPYNPDLENYFSFARQGLLIHYCARLEGAAVGYGNCYVFKDMHNQTLSAQEDTIYMLPEHRNGAGRRLLKFVLADLKQRGVKSLTVTAMTDLRVAKLWQRMGFKPMATAMRYEFERV
jgi:ribosomal protein S18 acetylase RimI-like enzyme